MNTSVSELSCKGMAHRGTAHDGSGEPEPYRLLFSPPVEQLNISFTFHGDRARKIGQMAQQLHGKASEATCRHVVTSATERGLASLRRELCQDDDE